ncbi:MAG: DUF1289 domain-containing protein [Gammaproteobacteria bacterium]|nr:DUF1289 domain-containing protein [Gammaproteobacteria bacterium]
MELDTPCIGICSTVYGDNVCRGCKRFYTEIIHWNNYDEIEKTSVFNRLNDLIIQVAQDKITIIDHALLRQTLENFNIRYRDDQSPLCWAYYLLRDARNKIATREEAGFGVADAYKNYNLVQLYQAMDQELFAHAEIAFKQKNNI